MIILALALVAISVSLLIVAVTLRSRSVATLNFLMCFAAAILIQPWSSLTIHPPIDPELRTDWVATMLWIFIFTTSFVGWIYCSTITAEKKPPSKRRKRKRRSSRRDRNVGSDSDISSDEA